MDMKPLKGATIVDAVELESAIASLVLAFDTDPVARWMYDDAHQYLLSVPRLFRALAVSSFDAKAAQRTSDGRMLYGHKEHFCEGFSDILTENYRLAGKYGIYRLLVPTE